MNTFLSTHPGFLTALISIPAIGSFLSAICWRFPERFLSRTVSLVSQLNLLFSLSIGVLWLLGNVSFSYSGKFFLSYMPHPLPFSLRYDLISFIYSLITAFLGSTVVHFSRVYMHREEGYSRFFFFLFMLLTGSQILAIADSLVFFFVGWELVGLSSFFLISFYRRNTNAVRGALKVFSVYRLGDLGLIFSMLLIEKLGHGSYQMSLSDLANSSLLEHAHNPWLIFLLGAGLMLAAAAKSAQFPFCFSLAKAMEGPTPSSAIFYGALSVHAGVLLLLRLFPLWFPLLAVRIIACSIGLTSVFLGTICGRVQTSIKGQLAYASVVQVGFMFVELSLGFNRFVLIHIVTHALLRAYQFLLSPSILSILLRFQSVDSLHLSFRSWSWERVLPSQVQSSLYVLSFQEAMLESFWVRAIVRPLRRVYEQYFFLILSFPLFLIILLHFSTTFSLQFILASGLVLAALLTALYTFCSENRFSLEMITSSFIFMAGGLVLLEGVAHTLPLFFLLPFWLLARLALYLVYRKGHHFQEQGDLFIHSPFWMWTFVFACCGILGVPPLPSFLFEEVLLSQMMASSLLLAILCALTITLNGIAIFKIFSQNVIPFPSSTKKGMGIAHPSRF